MVTEIEEKQRSHSSPVKYVNFIPWNKNKVLNLFCWPNFYEISGGSFLLLLLEILGICLFPVKSHSSKKILANPYPKRQTPSTQNKRDMGMAQAKAYFFTNLIASLPCLTNLSWNMLDLYTQTTPHLITKIGTSKVWAVIMSFNTYSKCQPLFFLFLTLSGFNTPTSCC